MIDRTSVERAADLFRAPEGSFERMLRRRQRKQRNQRLTAAAVGIVVFVAAIALVGGGVFDRGRRPFSDGPTGSEPTVGNGEITISDYPGNGEGIRAIDPAGGPEHQLVACTDACYDIGSPDWSPDGAQLAYFESSYERPDLNGIYVLDAQTGETTRLTHCPDGCPNGQGGIDWSPDGSKIAYSGDGIFVMDADGSNPVKLPTGPVAEPEGVSWSPDGARIAFIGREGDTYHVYTMNLDGSDLTPLTNGSMYECCNSPSWSPDGTKIVYFVTPKAGARWGSQVWVMSSDGSGKTLLADFECCQDVYGSIWSPDGTKIAFVVITDPDVAPDLYVMNADGSELTRVAQSWGRPAWRPIVGAPGG